MDALGAIIKPTSIDQFTEIVKRLENRDATKYPAEDITALTTDFLSDIKELEDAGKYEQKLTHTILQIVLKAGGKDNEDFRHDLRTLKSTVELKLLEMQQKPELEQARLMAAAKLSPRDVIRAIKAQYQKQKAHGLWPPAMNAPDTRAPPGHAFVLAPNSGVPIAAKGTCYNCGQQGHYANNCPAKNSGGGGNGSGGGRGNSKKTFGNRGKKKRGKNRKMVVATSTHGRRQRRHLVSRRRSNAMTRFSTGVGIATAGQRLIVRILTRARKRKGRMRTYTCSPNPARGTPVLSPTLATGLLSSLWSFFVTGRLQH